MSLDTESVRQMMGVMEEQLRVIDDLTAVGKKKSEVLVGGDLQRLDILLRGEQALIWHMKQLEERRFRLAVAMASQMGTHPSALTLDSVIAGLPDDDRAECKTVVNRFSRTAEELAEVNQLNADLVQQAMAYVDYTLQAFGAGRRSTGKVYSPAGPQGLRERKLHRLDNRV
jgi:flagellar biosynthesis/type III secretory pathway chaperone